MNEVILHCTETCFRQYINGVVPFVRVFAKYKKRRKQFQNIQLRTLWWLDLPIFLAEKLLPRKWFLDNVYTVQLTYASCACLWQNSTLTTGYTGINIRTRRSHQVWGRIDSPLRFSLLKWKIRRESRERRRFLHRALQNTCIKLNFPVCSIVRPNDRKINVSWCSSVTELEYKYLRL